MGFVQWHATSNGKVQFGVIREGLERDVTNLVKGNNGVKFQSSDSENKNKPQNADGVFDEMTKSKDLTANDKRKEGEAKRSEEQPKTIVADGFGFYNPYWLLSIANTAIVIHLVGAYQVYCQLLFALNKNI